MVRLSALRLAVVVVSASLAVAAAAATAADIPALVAKLGADDYRERERAGAALAALGQQAVPDLKAALTKSADPETARRLAALLEQLESSRLTEPTRITLAVERKPAKEVFAEIARQSGYKFRFDASPGDALVTFDWRGIPFLQAVDQLCETLELDSNVEDPDGTVQVCEGDTVDRYSAYAGPFRVSVECIHCSRTLRVGGLSRRNPLASSPTVLEVNVRVTGEPKARLCALGRGYALQATDEFGNSLVVGGPGAATPAIRTNLSYSFRTAFHLSRVNREADFVRQCRMKVVIGVVSETRAEIVVTDVAGSRGDKITGRDHFLEVRGTGVDGDAATVSVAVRPKRSGYEDAWIDSIYQRFEGFDARGQALRFKGVSVQTWEPNGLGLRLNFAGPAGVRKPPKVATLHLVDRANLLQTVEFAFKDLPMP